ncbi:MAG: hypothetical protein JWO22_574 [Frankiales bacterium]|nr:hypothetical protein [Frankiales bacterium]
MDLEHDLRRVLHERSTPTTDVDVVPLVHAGMRRRVRRQRLSWVGAAAGVAGLWVGALVVLQPAAGPTTPQVPTTLIANVPSGFQIRDLTFVSTTRGYALGTVPCTGGSHCTVLLQTDTGTREWERAIAPSVRTSLPDGTGCPAGLCVSQLRFARDAAGEEIGYAFGPSYALFSGGEWQPQLVGHRVEALEAARAGSVVRVLARPGGGHVVQRSTVGSSDWTTVLDITAPTYNAVLKRQGDRLVLVTYDNNRGAGAEPDVSDVRYSRDGGLTWDKGAHDPCDGDSYFAAVALARQSEVVAACTHRTGGSYVRVSKDDGTLFGPALDLPKGLDALQVAAPSSGGSWLVSGDVASERARVVVRSEDHGRTWTRVATEPTPDGVRATGYLDNSNARTVWWIGADPRFVWRTDDAGKTWTAARFR